MCNFHPPEVIGFRPALTATSQIHCRLPTVTLGEVSAKRQFAARAQRSRPSFYLRVRLF